MASVSHSAIRAGVTTKGRRQSWSAAWAAVAGGPVLAGGRRQR
jgi:hypothetical protein